MAYHRGVCAEDYYSSSVLTGQALEARSSSVSSTSSAASPSTPHDAALYTHHADIPRTLSPASSTSGSETNNGLYHRNQYPGFGHEHLHVSQPHPPSLPSQYLHAQVALFRSPYTPPLLSARRDSSRSSPYGGYPVSVLHQQPSPLSYDSDPSAMYPSFSITPYNSSPALPPSHQAAPVDHRPPTNNTCKQRDDNPEHKPSGLVDSPEEFEQSFDDLASLLEAERNFGRSDPEKSGTSKPTRKSDSKVPPGLACYHCLKMKSYHKFELVNHKSSSSTGREQAGDTDEDAAETRTHSPTPAPTTTRERSGTPSSSLSSSSSSSTASSTHYPSLGQPFSNANPHYAPTLTRTSLSAAARNGSGGHGGSGGGTGGHGSSSRQNQRVKKTFGVRRFCIPCGLWQGFYRPRDVIEVQRPTRPNEAYWVCDCRRLLRRDGEEVRCEDCGSCAPFSSPSD
ncbi:hypothetical protein N658DRAFT_483098 [Parathielavia hyrcaniae]|uniref:Uncharacterized protein n=1 Tax=Parathielavia hyrcaniae TaxID=113614 RepID=A0AAN6QCD8_9PEZI|nr:hypothetical protein N658DRAFT_483098 [Parathielavia hyrcaniae]